MDKTFSTQKIKLDWYLSLAFGATAFLLYYLTLANGVFPGESARLMVVYTGIENPVAPAHPIWSWLIKLISGVGLGALPFRLNLFSAFYGSVTVSIFYRLISWTVHHLIQEEYSVDYAERTSTLAAVTGSFALMVSVPFWAASTRLQYQGFDLLLLLITLQMLIYFIRSRNGFFLFLTAFLYGVGCVESVTFIALSPAIAVLGLLVFWRSGTFTLTKLMGAFVCMLLGLSLYFLEAWSFSKTGNMSLRGYTDIFSILITTWKDQLNLLSSGMPRVGWMLILLTSVLPWIVSALVSPRALNNERTWSQYILHISLTTLCIIGLVNAPISPWGLYRSGGVLPVTLYAMITFNAAYLAAYWYLMLKVRRPPKGQTISKTTQLAGEWMSLILLWPFVGFVFLTVLINFFEARGSRGDFADRFADEVLDRLGTRSWLISDGLLDDHLKIRARVRKQDVTLISLQEDTSVIYQRQLKKIVSEKKLFADKRIHDRMMNTLDLGVLPFVQDWMSYDKDIARKLAVFSVPDFWYSAGYAPIPEYLFFVGLKDQAELKDADLYPKYTAFWNKMEAILDKGKNEKAQDPVEHLRGQLRRQLGFIGNNLGVMFEDFGKQSDAEKTYVRVRKIDPENISALFNQFEMVRRGRFQQNKDRVEKELKDFLSSLKRRYPLWSLSRYYGYVRSPELFAQLGWGWAVSGQAGAALAGVTRAIELLPEGQRTFALQTMAAIYNIDGNKEKTASIYRQMLKADAKNQSALLGLSRLALLEGNIKEARSWLEAASATDKKKGAFGVEWAMLYLVSGDLGKARLILQETTDLQPKNVQAWAMLCMLQIQQGEIDDVEKITLPKMEAVVGSMDDYFIQVTRGQLHMSRFEKFNKQALSNKTDPAIIQKQSQQYLRPAREAYLRASMLRPDINGVKDLVLQLDIAMNDQERALLHARQVLRVDRKHPLANYIMGSLRLQEGSYGDAEDFLRRSVEDPEKASPAALNDLAETCRRIKKMDDAERFARAAVKKGPDLYIAWETLSSVLLENGKLAEAEAAIKKSQELDQADVRVMITLAKVYLRQDNMDRARMTINSIRGKYNTLSAYDQEEFRKVAELVK